MFEPHEVNKECNFIGGWYLKDTTICDTLIDYWEQHPNKRNGVSSHNKTVSVYKDIKNSVDASLSLGLLRKFNAEVLNPAAKEYQKLYGETKRLARWKVSEIPQVQWYEPKTGGFHDWHCERSNAYFPASSRVLVWMMYLNDITDGGETEFLYQKLKIKPQKGLVLIWPSEWTHTHRGLISNTQEKMIVTGWFNYEVGEMKWEG
jgi:hypothetical protein